MLSGAEIGKLMLRRKILKHKYENEKNLIIFEKNISETYII